MDTVQELHDNVRYTRKIGMPKIKLYKTWIFIVARLGKLFMYA